MLLQVFFLSIRSAGAVVQEKYCLVADADCKGGWAALAEDAEHVARVVLNGEEVKKEQEEKPFILSNVKEELAQKLVMAASMGLDGRGEASAREWRGHRSERQRWRDLIDCGGA